MNFSSKTPLILFDGYCNLCNTSIQYIIKNDKKKLLLFTALSSVKSKEILANQSDTIKSLDSILLYYNDKLYYKSSAVLKIAKLLGGIYSLTVIFWIIPRPIRDLIYNWIAKNRYKWFGKKSQCMIPTPELKKRFID